MATEWISPTWRMPEESNQSKFENYSLEFPGTGGYVTCTSAGDLFGNNEAFTFSFWCKVNTMAAYKAFFDFSPNAGFGLLALRTQSTSVIELLKSGASLGTYSFSDTSSFHNFCIVYDKTDIKLYIDNVEVISSAQTNMGDFTGLDLHIANGYFLTSLLDCNFSDVCLFKYAASSDQRNYLFNSGTPQNPMAISGQPPVAYYPLGGGSTGDAADPATTLTVPNDAVPSATVFNFVSSDGDRFVIPGGLGTGPVNGINGALTVSIWVNTTAGLIYEYAVVRDQAGGTNRDWFLWKDNFYGGGGRMYFAVFNTSNVILQVRLTGSTDPQGDPLITMNDGKWHHIVGVYNGTDTVELYTDGILQGTNTSAGHGALNTTARTAIGGYNSGSDISVGSGVWNGDLSNAQIWNTNISSAEIATLYNNGVPYTGTQPQAANLKGWWKMNVDTSTWDGNDWIIGEAQANYTSALSFNGTTNVALGPTQNSGAGSSSITFSCWMRSTETTVYADTRVPFGSRPNGGGNYTLGRIKSQYATPTELNVELVGSFGTTVLNDGEWHHLVFSWDSSTYEAKAYVDGNTTPEITVTFPSWNHSFTSFGIGWNGFNTVYNFLGNVSNCLYYDKILTSSEVETLYNNGTPEISPSFSPYGWWKCDNLTTGIQDSVGSNNGTNNGATVTDIQVSTLNGISSGMTTANLVNSDLTRSIPYSSYSMEFDGVNDYILTGSAIDLGTSCSISFWYSGATSGRNGSVVGGRSFAEGGVSSNYQAIFLSSGTYLAFYQSNSSTPKTFIYGSSPMNSSDWFHAVIVRDGANLNLYLNGADTSTSYTDLDATAKTYIRNIATNGENQTGAQTLTGKISNVSLYNSALTQDQILTIYNGGVPNDISSLSPVSWWSLAGDSYFNGNDWICPDLGSGGNNGTSSGMGGTELVGDGPGSTANGIATSMDIPANLKGNAPNSSKNAFSINMNSADRVEDVPA